MFFDKRLSWDTVTTFASIYFRANCYHYVNSDVEDMEPYETEVMQFVRARSIEVVPLICVDKQLKIAASDIARNAWNNATSAANSRAFGTFRRQFRDGTNGVIRLVLGGELFDLMESSFKSCAKIIKSPISSMTAEEASFLAATSFALRNKAIGAGLVRP